MIEIQSFVFMTFRVGDVSGFENVCVAVEIWNFKIWLGQTRHYKSWNEKVLNTEELELIKLYLSYNIQYAFEIENNIKIIYRCETI